VAGRIVRAAAADAVYLAATHTPFSHAYYGSIRHAITVGFASQMIMGVAAYVVPALRGVPRQG
jgi:hypothetical protein